MWTGKVSWFHAIYDRWLSYENIMLGRSCLYCLLFHSWVFWLNLKAKSRVMFLIKYQFSRAASSYFLLAWPRVHILCHFLTKIKKKYINLQKNHFKSIDQTCIFELQDIPFVELWFGSMDSVDAWEVRNLYRVTISTCCDTGTLSVFAVTSEGLS